MPAAHHRALALALLTVAWPLASGDARAEEDGKLQVFGFLTQAYGWSERGSIRGTSEDGSTDLRNLALQFRWQRSDREAVVVQLSHERRGNDFLFPDEDEVELDWAFYQLQIGARNELKVGRLNLPLGIYNEIRDVGTLLPFFDLPVSFYAGVLSTAETLDGVSFARTFAPRSEWDLEATAYFGGWETFEQKVDLESRFLLSNLPARAENGLGVQLWLNTPTEGLRLGAGFLTWQLESPLSGPGARNRWRSWHLSFDLARERWLFRSEMRRWRFEQDVGAFIGGPSLVANAERDGFYAQAGVWLTPRLALFGQVEDLALRDDSALVPQLEDFHQDAALSLNYRFRPDLLLKAELHSSDTFFPLGSGDPPPGPGQLANEVEWAIVALSVDF